MEYIKVFSKTDKPELLPRKKLLEHLAAHLGVDSKKYKNRTLLSEAITDSLTYNTTDPVTLENIRDIEDDDKIFWWQNHRRYVARISTMRRLMKSGNTMNPWVTDTASGIQQSEDPDEYDRRYNMTHVEKIAKIATDVGDDTDGVNENVPTDVAEFFEFENVCEDLYTTRLTEILQNAHAMDGYLILMNGLDLTFHQYRVYNDTQSIQMLQIFHDNIDYNTRPLKYILDMFAFIRTAKPDNSTEIIRSVIFHMNECIRI